MLYVHYCRYISWDNKYLTLNPCRYSAWEPPWFRLRAHHLAPPLRGCRGPHLAIRPQWWGHWAVPVDHPSLPWEHGQLGRLWSAAGAGDAHDDGDTCATGRILVQYLSRALILFFVKKNYVNMLGYLRSIDFDVNMSDVILLWHKFLLFVIDLFLVFHLQHILL